MKLKILSFLFFSNFITICAQNSINSIEIGINSDYWVSKNKYKLYGIKDIRIPYFSYTRTVKKVYLKAEYAWATYHFENDGPNIFTDSQEGFTTIKSIDIFNIGIAYKDLFKLKNTMFFFNLAYIDYIDLGIAKGINLYEGQIYAVPHILKSLGAGFEVKQKINLPKNFYAHANMSYNFYFKKKENPLEVSIEHKYVPVSRQYLFASVGLGYRF